VQGIHVYGQESAHTKAGQLNETTFQTEQPMKIHKRTFFFLLSAALTAVGATSAEAFYNPATGRWLSRDPVGEVSRGALYGFVENDPAAKSDALGLFSIADHKDFTGIGFWGAMYDLGGPGGSACQHRMLSILNHQHFVQDVLNAFSLRRHYNRSLSASSIPEKRAADTAYQTYLDLENVNYAVALANPSSSSCRAALIALGRLTHSWQDFFAHAIRRDGLGGFEPGSPSHAQGWVAWSAGVTGDPGRGDRGNFWPSSYSIFGGGEHPPFAEPIVHGGSEYISRITQAKTYAREQFDKLLPTWFEKCKCFCVGEMGPSNE
jgi:hypothetical protein